NALRAPALWAFAHTALRQPKFYQGPRDVQLRQITLHLLAIQKNFGILPAMNGEDSYSVQAGA
ncbi:hypothetical protein, partial [Xylella fastidiosa]|uniref:hypothetical protein n=1 Tax=Xylella fastidiosa TaxID=2371 RepID=UPI001EECF328